MPKITLPVFDSDPTLWIGFWDVFNCSVHSNAELSDIQKFTYLRGKLNGEAKQLIEGFAIEGASYQTAVALLQKTYGYRDRIKAAHITNLTILNRPSYYVEELKGFYASF